MNYFIEGLQGSGKSTLVKKLSEISIFDQGEILTGNIKK